MNQIEMLLAAADYENNRAVFYFIRLTVRNNVTVRMLNGYEAAFKGVKLREISITGGNTYED
ncbi:MAG: hypothetical protein LUI14_16295 [Lachnospiraceae bacterium]|nr:hypothetical protein [Lachnospiraceae bacterium]MCD7766845.1 hypothetical protein [Lachnospiraceae bacterium]